MKLYKELKIIISRCYVVAIRCNISYCTVRGRVIALWLLSYVLLSFAEI